ncbi:hypothetical protein WMY93_005389 [Mugilogobius chulae]|uniref:LITAF domain-containing protein n=1 Tax=Mugilogobius chulae TaxID=88201 RepID=A0AAW0PJY4_9GOBI
MECKLDEPLPTPPSYILPEGSQLGHGARMYNVQSSFSPPPPPSFSFSPAACESQSSLAVPPVTPAKPIFVCYETILCRSPGLTTCPSCQLQVTTRVTYKPGALAWASVSPASFLGELWLGCCVVPLVVDYFKDTYHTAPAADECCTCTRGPAANETTPAHLSFSN